MHILIPELVTEGRSSDFSFKIKAKEESPMEKTKRQFSDIIRQAKESIKFDPATHTYYINGKKADTSVTQYVHSGESFD